MADEPSHVRITNLMMYEKLMDINENQITMMAELKTLSSLPDRMRDAESRLDKMDWLEKVAYAALGSGAAALITTVVKAFVGA